MTIYTPTTEKKSDKSDAPEVVTEPLTGFKDEERDELEIAPKVMRVTYHPRSRRNFCIHLLLTVMVLVIMACGTIGGIVFYRHLNKKVFTGKCGNVYFDATYHELNKPDEDSGNAASLMMSLKDDSVQMDYIEEGIEVSEISMYEQLYTPQFDEVREHHVWHDFVWNYTVIVDHEWKGCYVMPLNRTAIAKPTDVIDLIEKLMSGYYMPNAVVIRNNYRVVYPPMSDLEPLGSRIAMKCSHYSTYWLEKIVSGVTKRSTMDNTAVYAMFSNHVGHQEIFKIIMHNMKQTEMDMKK